MQLLSARPQTASIFVALLRPPFLPPVDESYVLPVLARFNGRPEVDNAGQIQYVFPDLQQTATVSVWFPNLTLTGSKSWASLHCRPGSPGTSSPT